MATSRVGDKPADIITVSTREQTCIRYCTPASKGKVSEVQSRITVENLDLHGKKPPALDDKDIRYLVDADKEGLETWAKEHSSKKRRLAVVAVDYKKQKVTRTDPYGLFTCDLSAEDQHRIDGEIAKIAPFSDKELKQYTQGKWWEVIDEQAHGSISAYEEICYRALRTLKEGKLDLDRLGMILNYCGVRIELPSQYEVITGKTFEDTIIENLKKDYTPTGNEDSLRAFIAKLPVEDKIFIKLNTDYIKLNTKFSNGAPLLFPPLLNKLAFHQFGSSATMVRSATASGGVADVDRFGSANERIMATFVPGVKPAKEIHGRSTFSWAESAYHDQAHQSRECSMEAREGWIAFAAYVRDHLQDESCYADILDKLSFSDFKLTLLGHIMPLMGERDPNISQSSFYSLALEWYKNNRNLFKVTNNSETLEKAIRDDSFRIARLFTEEAIKQEKKAIQLFTKQLGEAFTSLEKDNPPLFGIIVNSPEVIGWILRNGLSLEDIKQLPTEDFKATVKAIKEFDIHILYRDKFVAKLGGIKKFLTFRDNYRYLFKYAEGISRFIEEGVSMDQLLSFKEDPRFAIIMNNSYLFNLLIQSGATLDRLFTLELEQLSWWDVYQTEKQIQEGKTFDEILFFHDLERQGIDCDKLSSLDLLRLQKNKSKVIEQLKEGKSFSEVLSSCPPVTLVETVSTVASGIFEKLRSFF